METSAPASGLQRIVLAGFMGSGKSTVGRVLAQRLGWRFADLDEAVAEHEGLTVPEIFAQHGEAVFRAAETDALRKLMQESGVVIALGGGAPETPGVRDLLSSQRKTAVIHLHAPFEILYARCVAQSEDPLATARPLLGARAAAAERYERRLPVYAAVAGFTANAGVPSPEVVAETILLQLGFHVAAA